MGIQQRILAVVSIKYGASMNALELSAGEQATTTPIFNALVRIDSQVGAFVVKTDLA